MQLGFESGQKQKVGLKGYKIFREDNILYNYIYYITTKISEATT